MRSQAWQHTLFPVQLPPTKQRLEVPSMPTAGHVSIVCALSRY